jgi:hypothetical protein
MIEGKALCDQALALQQQRARYGDKYGAADAHAGAQAQAHHSYKQYCGVARVALRSPRSAAQKLGLQAPQPTTQAGWLLQAQQFYVNALADSVILGALAAGQAQVATVAASAVARQVAQAVAQKTSRAARPCRR